MATPSPTNAPQPLLVMTLARGAAVQGAAIAADAVVSETHTRSNTVTDHPVEEGVNVSDHSRPEPDTLQVEMYISDTPTSLEQTQRAQKFMQQAGLNAGATTQGNSQISEVPGYSRAVRDRLDQYRLQATLLTVTTAIKTYTSMVVQSISETRTAKDAEAFHATVTFKFIRVVQNKLTRRVVSKDGRVGNKAKTGNKTTQQNSVEQSQLDKGYENAKGKSGINAAGAFISGVFGGGG